MGKAHLRKPIHLEDGRIIKILADARDAILALPEKELHRPRWTCEAAADRTAVGQTGGANVRDVASCMRDENEARDQLAKEWGAVFPR